MTKTKGEVLQQLQAIPEGERTLEQQALISGDNRINALTSALFKIIIAGTIAFALVMAYLFGQSYEGRVELTGQAREGCISRVFNTADGIEELTRHAENWSNASAARRRDGDTKVADTYARNSRADTKAADRKLNRLEGANFEIAKMRDKKNRPTFQARAEVDRACKLAWPDASPWPWTR